MDAIILNLSLAIKIVEAHPFLCVGIHGIVFGSKTFVYATLTDLIL